MAFELPTHALGPAETFIAVDPAANAGVCVVALKRASSEDPTTIGWPNLARAPVLSKAGRPFDLSLHWSEHRGGELATARMIVKRTAGPITLLAEAQFVGINPSSTARIVTSRARWCMAFETAAEEEKRPLAVHHVPPSAWQCEYLGLPANAGSDAMKLASALSAQHVLLRLTGQRSDIEGDAADALCLNMWALEHFLAQLPRKFKRA